jgi:hypothetical protein
MHGLAIASAISITRIIAGCGPSGEEDAQTQQIPALSIGAMVC